MTSTNNKIPITYISKFVNHPDVAFSDLLALDWEKRDDAPRCEYYCNDFSKPYLYGKGRGQRTYEPRPYQPAILGIRKKLEELTQVKFEVCFLNLYKNQRDHLGWHADDSPEMDDARPIVTVSLGVEREIWFRQHRKDGVVGDNLVKDVRLKLEHGSCCIMAPGMQDTWQHRIPKAGFECGERISLTFRGYVI